MIVEISAVISTVVGGILLAQSGKKKEQSNETQETQSDVANDAPVLPENETIQDWQAAETDHQAEFQDWQVIETQETQSYAEQTPQDPRQNSMYFGNADDEYDPFYDYSNDMIYNSEYALNSIEGMKATRANAYRCRIISPAFGYKDIDCSKKMGYAFANYGLPVQTFVSKQNGAKMQYMPFVRGNYTEVSFVMEVFNPFDFDSELEKMRISSVSVGGEEVYIIPNHGEREEWLGSFYRPELRKMPNADSLWAMGDMRLSSYGVRNYQSHYLYRFYSDSPFANKNTDCWMQYEPSDFEFATFKQTSIWDRMKTYDQNQFELSKLPNLPFDAWTTPPHYNSTYSFYEELCEKLKMSNRDSTDAGKVFNEIVAVNAGIKNPLDGIPKRIMIPARGSVFVMISLPLTKKPTALYKGLNSVRDSDTWKNSVGDTDWRVQKKNGQYQWEYKIHLKSGRDQIDTYKAYLSEQGGAAFITTSSVGIKEQDFRLKLACFSDASQSVVQNHKALTQRAENCKWFDIGMYRGGRPKGEYMWEKSYWEDIIPVTSESSSFYNMWDTYEQTGCSFLDLRDSSVYYDYDFR